MAKKTDLDKLIIYDIECTVSTFLICCKDYKTGVKKHFVMYHHKEYEGQALEFKKFISNCVNSGYSFLGFNNINYDAQLVQYFYDWCCEKQDPLHEFDNEYIVEQMYKESQKIIGLPEAERYKYLLPENKLFAPQIDLFKQLHYDRPAKYTSLKWVQFAMRSLSIQDMPFDHDDVLNYDDLQIMLDYCWHDVEKTADFFDKVKYETDVRHGMSNEYKLNLLNASEPKMVRDIFATFLTKEMDITTKDLRELKTFRKQISFKDIIFPYVQFVTPEFKALHKVFTDKVLDANPHSTDKFAHTFNFHEMDVDLGLGGIHACAAAGVYTHTEDEVIEDADGTSFYPFLAIQNGLRPEHLGEAFNKVYPMMYEERKKYAKKDPKNYIFKIILNSAYGLSKEINGYLYDPKFTYAVTINGQLSLLMLVEALNKSIPEIEFIQMNTDGITYKYNKKYTETVRKICAWWEKTTKIGLEYAYYKKMVIRDVNNYLAITENGDVKKKGCFETEMPFHKNPSSLIVPKALEQYFVNNLRVTDYINNPENSIFDYCNGTKKKSNFKLNLIQYFGEAEFVAEQQKVTRYIITKKNELSGLLVKDFHDGRRIAVEANKQVMPLNVIEKDKLEAKYYPLDYADYIKEAQKIISSIEPEVTQLDLFS